MNYTYTTTSWFKTYYHWKYIISCLYNKNGNNMVLDFFEIDSSLKESTTRESKTFFIAEEAQYIKGDLVQGNQALIFGWLNTEKVPNYMKYNIQTDTLSAEPKLFGKSFCKLNIHGFKIKYYPEKNEVIYTCLFDSNGWTVPNANILVETLHVQAYQTNYTYKYNNCSLNSYSIVYYEEKTEYYIISDAQCANETKSFCLLFGDYKPKPVDYYDEEENEKSTEEEKVKTKEAENTIVKEKEKEKEEIIEEEKTKIKEEKEEKINIKEEEGERKEENIEIKEEEKFNYILEEKINKIEEEIAKEEEKEKYKEEEEKEKAKEEEKTEEREEKSNIIEEEKIDKMEEEEENVKTKEKEKEIIEEEKSTIKEEETSKPEKETDKQHKEEEKEIKEKGKEKENIILEKYEKCELYNEESKNLNLCIKCNKIKGYYFLNIYSVPKEEITDEYIDCVNNVTKPSNFYYDAKNEDFRPCYETCETCNSGGSFEINNCKTCERNYIFKPDMISTTNCVMKCPFYYFYKALNQYRCTENKYCPLDHILLIKEKGKCIKDCKKDDTYKFQYDNQCFKECPLNTITDNTNFICKDENVNISSLTETNHVFFDKNVSDGLMNQFVKSYMNNFNYTLNHITLYNSEGNLKLAVYKNINNKSVGIPKIDLGQCYEKIINKYNITNDNLIIVLAYEKYKEDDKIISFSVYNPNNGEKIILNDICMNDSVIIQEDLKKKIPNLESFIYLTNQGIDLLNPQNEFYTDLCFHYKSPIDGKDIPLKERFKLFFPNVSLCDKGCFTKGINTTTNTSICECTLNNLITNSILEENVLLQGIMDEFKTLLQDTNIEVLRCYKDLSNSELYSSNHGSFIIIGLIFGQIIFTIIYCQKYIFSMTKYLFHVMENLISFLKIKKVKIILITNQKIQHIL